MAQTLLADMGGTNIRFAVEDGQRVGKITHFKCANFPSFSDALSTYLKNLKISPKRFVLAVPAPVTGDKLSFVNNAWHFSIKAIKKQFHFDAFYVVNDFEAQAMAIPFLKEKDVQQIGQKIKSFPASPRVILGAGTGLGMGVLLPNSDGTFRTLASEGGHVGASASISKEEDIIRFAAARYGRVSFERFISGKGLSLLYEYEGGKPISSKKIVALAIKGNEKATQALLQMFAFWGAFCGDMALTLGALGGVYLSGGIIQAQGILDILERSEFRSRFENKGRHSAYVKRIPTFVITQEDTAFLGLQAFSKSFT